MANLGMRPHLYQIANYYLYRMNFTKDALQKETSYKTSRSGGKGGQNVNKVSSKVELLFSIDNSLLFTDEEKELLNQKLQSRFNKDGLVQVVCDEERSQYLNKEKAVERLINILTAALHKPKVRKASKVSKAAKQARLQNKRLVSLKKDSRRKDPGNED
jgi:ribosome-associated protein